MQRAVLWAFPRKLRVKLSGPRRKKTRWGCDHRCWEMTDSQGKDYSPHDHIWYSLCQLGLESCSSPGEHPLGSHPASLRWFQVMGNLLSKAGVFQRLGFFGLCFLGYGAVGMQPCYEPGGREVGIKAGHGRAWNPPQGWLGDQWGLSAGTGTFCLLPLHLPLPAPPVRSRSSYVWLEKP